MGEGQWRVDDALTGALNEIDRALDDDLNSGNAREFTAHLNAMHELVRSSGSPVGYDEVLPSDAFVPPPDITLDELRELVSPEGLIPG